MVPAAIVVGIDSAETSRIVVLQGRRIIRRGICRVTGWADVERCPDSIAAFAPVVVAVEAPYVRLNPVPV